MDFFGPKMDFFGTKMDFLDFWKNRPFYRYSTCYDKLMIVVYQYHYSGVSGESTPYSIPQYRILRLSALSNHTLFMWLGRNVLHMSFNNIKCLLCDKKVQHGSKMWYWSRMRCEVHSKTTPVSRVYALLHFFVTPRSIGMVKAHVKHIPTNPHNLDVIRKCRKTLKNDTGVRSTEWSCQKHHCYEI